MNRLEELAEEFAHFIFEETELGRTYDPSTIGTLAKLQNGWVYTPDYDLNRFLTRKLIEESPGTYTIHRTVKTDNNIFVDSDRIPMRIQTALIPPRERDHKPWHDDKYDDVISAKLHENRNQMLQVMIERKLVKESRGYGFINNDQWRTNPYPLIVDARMLKNKGKKKQLLGILPFGNLRKIQLAHPHRSNPHQSSLLAEKSFSPKELIEEDIWKLARKRYTVYDFETYGVRLP